MTIVETFAVGVLILTAALCVAFLVCLLVSCSSCMVVTLLDALGYTNLAARVSMFEDPTVDAKIGEAFWIAFVTVVLVYLCGYIAVRAGVSL